MKLSHYVLLILCFYACFATSCSKQKSKPNVLLLTLDTLRADALGCYGNPTIKTPNLDRLASEGVLFEDAICQIPATLTSHTAILTGLYPKTTGVRFRTNKLVSSEKTLTEIFADNNYKTAAFISSYVLEPAFGLAQGFDRYDLGSMIRNGKKVLPERRAEETISDSIDYLESNKDNSFFLWVHLYDPHTPYDPPSPFSTMYDSEYQGSIRGTVAEITKFTATHGSDLNQRDLKHLRSLYDGEVSYMDHHIGRIIQKLNELEIMDNSIIAAIADHGESLGEHGRFFHGEDLYQPAIKIPFMIRYPFKIKEGIRVPELVQSIDLFPTLLELADIDANVTIDGNSLLPLISSEDTTSKVRPGFMETEADMVCESNKTCGIRTEEYKFIHQSASRRPETPLGIYTEIPLKGPSIVMLRIKGDASIRLMAHVRYRTQELYTSRDPKALSQLNSTVVKAETFGTDPMHNQTKKQTSFLSTPPRWRLQISPDLYRLARNYGKTRGWPTQWMVIEGVGVDAALPYNQTHGTFVIDQIELYSPALQFPNSPKFRDPFWIIEDFEGERGLTDANEGPPHTTKMTWKHEKIFRGNKQQQVEITFTNQKPPASYDELFHIHDDPEEKQNLLIQNNELTSDNKILKTAENCKILVENWKSSSFGTQNILELDSAQREALESLGYTR